MNETMNGCYNCVVLNDEFLNNNASFLEKAKQLTFFFFCCKNGFEFSKLVEVQQLWFRVSIMLS